MEGPGETSTSLARFQGALLGGAIADALALPYLHYSRAFLRSLADRLTKDFAEPTNPMYHRGQPSDDTQEALAATLSIVEAQGFTLDGLASHLLPLWRDHLLVERDAATAVAMMRLARGETDCHGSGLDAGHAEVAPASRALPLSLWFQTREADLLREVRSSTRLTHTDPRTLASASAFAAAVAVLVQTEELLLGVFLDRVAAAAGNHDSILAEAILDLPRTLSMSEYRALRHFESLEPDDRYPASEEGLGTYAIPVLLTAIYYFLRNPYRWERVVEPCLRAGGHMDTLSFLAGALCGALVGEGEIPAHLKDGLLGRMEITTAAQELHAAWLQQPPL